MSKNRLSTQVLIALCCCLFACGPHKTSRSSRGNSQAAFSPAKASIVEKMKEYGDLPIEERIAIYQKLKKENRDAYDFANEFELNMYGYAALWNNNAAEAIEIFKLVVKEFPSSPNAYDSLGEAYLQNGNKELSLFNYEKALALNPDNFNAEDQIERIKYPDKKPEKPTDKFAKVYTAKQYRDDLDNLGKKLLSVHSNPLKFISRKEFWKTVEQKKALITNHTTYGEFVWHCSEIIANVHCSHTSMGSFYPEREMLPLSTRFPLQTRLVNNQLFVIDSFNNKGKVKIKDEILSINGIAVSTIVNNIYKHIPAQGHIKTTKRHVFNHWSTCLIPYELGFPETYTITVKGLENPVVLNKAEVFKAPFPDQSLKPCKDDLLCFEVLGDSKTAVLTIFSFNFYPWNNLDVFKDFMDKTFAGIQKEGIEHLVIDVRLNGGGSSESSIYLLQYLLDKPFVYYATAQFKDKIEKAYGEEEITPFENRYKGKLYFMIDGLGNSTTGHFMSLVKLFKLGPIVGEELGSNQFCSAGQTICRLPNTKLEYYVADNTHESTATSFPDEVGILPDYYVTQSIEDYLKKVDVVKEFTLSLIKK
jgi:C-terminal processing protease CtpA/Prc